MTCLHELVKAQFNKHADEVALIFRDRELSYGQLGVEVDLNGFYAGHVF